jgi:transaldolase
MALRPAVFLDRDGTLNHQIIRDGKPFAASSLEEFRLFEGVPECCRALKAAGFLLVVVTNQPDVGRGTLSEAVVDAIHARLSELVPEIDRVEACYDPGRGEGSLRRKPEPGMILDAAKALGIDLSRSWMVGDRWRDVECGRRAGVKTVFIDFRYSEKFAFEPDYTVDTFPEAASLILRMAGGGASGVYSTCPIPNSDLNSEAQKPMKSLSDLRIHIYADGADKAGILDLYAKPYIKGLTTNPSLMKKAGIKDYEAFAKDILQTVKAKPISLEVFTDDFAEMKRQALKISALAKNVYTKIPITNSRGESSLPLVRELAKQGVKLNITAILTLKQVAGVAESLNPAVPSVVSVFAGRIADTGVDPVPLLRACGALLEGHDKAELLWASCREVLNIFQAEECGCDIITVPHDILAKAAKMLGMDLTELSLDTVRMFAKDAAECGYRL